MFKQNSDFFAIHVQKDIIPSISALNIRNDLKEADIIPVYKKRSRFFKEDYRPISTLPNIFKVYEKCLCDQIWKYFETRFSKFQCIFRKCYSSHNCLLAMNEKWTTVVNNGVVLFFMVFRKVSYLPKIIIFVDHFLKKKNRYFIRRYIQRILKCTCIDVNIHQKVFILQMGSLCV